MKTIAGFITLALALVHAAPTAHPDAAAAALKSYHFETRVIAGKQDFNDLYVSTYHTGAGLSVATLTKDQGHAGHLNGTKLIFRLGDYDYGMSLPGAEDFYAGWSRTTIDVEQGDSGFAISEQGYLVNNKPRLGFTGWRVCRWNHVVPELFHDNPEVSGFIPSNCATVHLVAVPV